MKTQGAFRFAIRCLMFLLSLEITAYGQGPEQTSSSMSLRASVWGDILKGLVGFIFGFIAFWAQRLFTRERRILTGYVSTFSLLSLPEQIRAQVQVRFRDQTIDNILSHRVTFLNTGNQVIQDHAIEVRLVDSEILHVDPGQRFNTVELAENYAQLKLRFLNPGDSSTIHITTTGRSQQELKVDGEGPGVRFNFGKSFLPMLEPTMTSEDIQKLMRKWMFDLMKKQLRWQIPIFMMLLGALLIFLYFTSY